MRRGREYKAKARLEAAPPKPFLANGTAKQTALQGEMRGSIVRADGSI